MSKKELCFEVGKVYQHNAGRIVKILKKIETTGYGQCLVAEDLQGNLHPFGEGRSYAVNWEEIPLSKWWSNWLEGNSDSSELKEKLEQALICETGKKEECGCIWYQHPDYGDVLIECDHHKENSHKGSESQKTDDIANLLKENGYVVDIISRGKQS